MQTDLIDTFLDLLETRSFHRSAERLGLTQSTISARVIALEQSVGARLFTRSRAGTNLTTEGLKFESHARGLRHAWNEAQRAVTASGTKALNLRIGIQHDLATGERGHQIGTWIAAFRKAFPECGFYIEPDYSAQMCADIARGILDFAVIYTPQNHADLHISSLGEVSYRLVSTQGSRRADLSTDSYIRAGFSPAFDRAHAVCLPEMGGASLASGQNAAMLGLLMAMGGAGFVMEDSSETLAATGKFTLVKDVPPITQPIYGVVHLRHRTSGMHKRMAQIVQRKMAEARKGSGGL
jgi:DNA-binding transcriptional LysR family regulator